MNVGRPRFIVKKSIKFLIDCKSNIASYAEVGDDLGENIITLKDGIDEECGIFVSSKKDSRKKVVYQLIGCKDNPDIHFANYNATINKYKRRQMASTLICNLVSQITAVSYSKFISV